MCMQQYYPMPANSWKRTSYLQEDCLKNMRVSINFELVGWFFKNSWGYGCMARTQIMNPSPNQSPQWRSRHPHKNIWIQTHHMHVQKLCSTVHIQSQVCTYPLSYTSLNDSFPITNHCLDHQHSLLSQILKLIYIDVFLCFDPLQHGVECDEGTCPPNTSTAVNQEDVRLGIRMVFLTRLMKLTMEMALAGTPWSGHAR